jgi:hypothetical protein
VSGKKGRSGRPRKKPVPAPPEPPRSRPYSRTPRSTTGPPSLPPTGLLDQLRRLGLPEEEIEQLTNERVPLHRMAGRLMRMRLAQDAEDLPGWYREKAAALADWYEEYAARFEKAEEAGEPEIEFGKWMRATASAVRRNDAVDAGYYAQGALLQLLNVSINSLGPLAEIGRKKLEVDKSKGRRSKPP